MSNQSFARNHRKYQILTWIRSFDENIGKLSSYPPTPSNLAYYLITEGEYRKNKLNSKFHSPSFYTPSGEPFQFVKRDLSRRVEQFNPNLFEKRTIVKTNDNHITLSEGIEHRSVSTTAYNLTETGNRKQARLSELIEKKQGFVKRVKIQIYSGNISCNKYRYVLKDKFADHFDHPKDEKVPVDSIIVPKLGGRWFETKKIQVPQIKITESPDDSLTISKSRLEQL